MAIDIYEEQYSHIAQDKMCKHCLSVHMNKFKRVDTADRKMIRLQRLRENALDLFYVQKISSVIVSPWRHIQNYSWPLWFCMFNLSHHYNSHNMYSKLHYTN